MKGFSKLGKWRAAGGLPDRRRVRGISLFFVPPNGETLAAVDWRVLGLLLCLMAVVAGLQSCGLFGRPGRTAADRAEIPAAAGHGADPSALFLFHAGDQ